MLVIGCYICMCFVLVCVRERSKKRVTGEKDRERAGERQRQGGGRVCESVRESVMVCA